MFNMDGQVIGINTAIYSPSGGSIGIGFAIPSVARARGRRRADPRAGSTVHRGWLGVRIQAVTDEIAESLGLDKAHGALVASVNDNGPAQIGGIQPGDVILTFDGKPVDRHAASAAACRRDPGRQGRAGDGLAQAAARPRSRSRSAASRKPRPPAPRRAAKPRRRRKAPAPKRSRRSA